MTRLLSTFLALVLFGYSPVFAHADEPASADSADLERKRRAYALMQEGKARFDIGKFDEAIDLFLKAYEVYPYPEALYSAAQGYRMKKDYEKAVFYYRSYLRNAPADAPNRDQVEARITEMERLDAEQKASAKQPPQGALKPPAPEGGPVAPPPAAGAPAATSADAPRWYADPWAWTLVGAGVVAVGTGSGLLVDAADRQYDDLPAGDMARVQEERDAERKEAIGWTVIGVGGAALAAGVVKLVLVPDAPKSTVDVVIAPRYLGLAGRF